MQIKTAVGRQGIAYNIVMSLLKIPSINSNLFWIKVLISERPALSGELSSWVILIQGTRVISCGNIIAFKLGAEWMAYSEGCEGVQYSYSLRDRLGSDTCRLFSTILVLRPWALKIRHHSWLHTWISQHMFNVNSVWTTWGYKVNISSTRSVWNALGAWENPRMYTSLHSCLANIWNPTNSNVNPNFCPPIFFFSLVTPHSPQQQHLPPTAPGLLPIRLAEV